MGEEHDWAVLDEIRIVRFIDTDGHESVSVDRKGDCSLITVLGMLVYELASHVIADRPLPL